MIVAPRFAYLHLHKSGGTFVNELLLRHVPDARQLGYHLPRTLLPPAAAALPVLGTVRNPWSYYVSWYAFQSARPEPNALFRVLSSQGTDFRSTVTRMLLLADEPVLLAQIVAALPANYTNRGLNLPGPALAQLGGSGRGFYSWLYGYLYDGGQSPLYVGRMERLRVELGRLLADVGQPVGSQFAAELERLPPRNASTHDHYTQYYDAGLAALVRERDAPVIERHGYEFGD